MFCVKSRLALVSIASLLSVGSAAAAEKPRAAGFTDDLLKDGLKISHAQCDALPDAVWVEHSLGTDCIRYYPSPDITAGMKPGQTAIFYFHGDWLAGRSKLSSYSHKVTPAKLYAEAKRAADALEHPFIFVARPGLYGSSGDHTQRRRPKEFYSLNAAVDAIKAKYRLGRITLVGQAGGATAVGALLTLGRTDVDCAVGTSGGYAVMDLAAWKFERAGSANPGFDVTGFSDPYDVIYHVGDIRPDPQRRIFVIGDPKDENTAFKFQQRFADALRTAGHHVSLLRGDAPEPDNHDLMETGYAVAGWCASGLSDDDIAARVVGPEGQ